MVEQKIVIDVPAEKDAKIIVDTLKEIIRTWGYARSVSLDEVINKYNIVSTKVGVVYIGDYEHGWTREEDIAYRRNDSNGWQVVLPIPEMIKPQKNTEEKKTNSYEIYLIMENDPAWPAPELISVETDYDVALETVYREACDLFVDCTREEDEFLGKHHRPLINKESDDGYVVIDEDDDMRRSYYIVEKEVEV